MSSSEWDLKMTTDSVVTDQVESRAAWRQRIVEAEWGVKTSFRSSSVLFLYFFAMCALVSTGIVVGLSVFEWAIMIQCLFIAVAGEMVYAAIENYNKKKQQCQPPDINELISITQSALTLLIAGCFVTMIFVLGSRIAEMWLL